MQKHFVGVYWGPRQESSHAAAKRLSQFLVVLEGLRPDVFRWFEKVRSRNSPLAGVATGAEDLEPLLKTNDRDVGGEPIIELGFDFSAWNGRESRIPASLSAHLGSFEPTDQNLVRVELTFESDPDLALLQDVLKAAVSAFDPEVGVVNTKENLQKHDDLPLLEVPALYRYSQEGGYSAA